MSEMIERIATIIAKQDAQFRPGGFDAPRGGHRALARELLEALRDRTEAMHEAALDVGPDRAPDDYWRAMIDAALGEQA